MRIRSAAKAAIVRDGRLLMQLCRTGDGIVYCELPGGGQRMDETLEEAVIRECLEETGYRVAVRGLLGVQEEIMTDEDVREAFPGYAHRIFHIFRCEIIEETPYTPTEMDLHQIGMVWIPLDELGRHVVRPALVKALLPALVESGEIGYLPAALIPDFFT